MDKKWKCTKPNNCEDNCKMAWPTKPTGCVYEDEEEIAKDADIWTEDVN